jgi:hypothetical protein
MLLENLRDIVPQRLAVTTKRINKLTVIVLIVSTGSTSIRFLQ